MFTMSSSDSTMPTTSQIERCSQKAKPARSAMSSSAGTACRTSIRPSMRNPRTLEMKLKNQAAWVIRKSTKSLIQRSEEHTSELQSLMRISYAVFCLKKKQQTQTHITNTCESHMNHISHSYDQLT